MIGLKLNAHTIRNAYSKTKNFLGRAYGQTRMMLSDIDMGVRVARDIYSIASAPMEAVLGEHFTKMNKHAMTALKGYDDIRSKVMDTDENVKNHYNAIVGDLKKKHINIGL